MRQTQLCCFPSLFLAIVCFTRSINGSSPNLGLTWAVSLFSATLNGFVDLEGLDERATEDSTVSADLPDAL